MYRCGTILAYRSLVVALCTLALLYCPNLSSSDRGQHAAARLGDTSIMQVPKGASVFGSSPDIGEEQIQLGC